MLVRPQPLQRPIIVLVGRMNVGKSTLYNRLTRRGNALVSITPATTRDVLTSAIEWQGVAATIVDTGGLSVPPEGRSFGKLRLRQEAREPIAKAVREQVLKMIQRADHCCLVVDGKSSITGEDEQWARYTRTIGKPVTLVVNKVDNPYLRAQAVEWLGLKIADVQMVSAANGSGVGDLLDHLLGALPKTPAVHEEPASDILILGKPNVGKSSLFNTLLGETASIVSPIAHTTREPHSRSITMEALDLTLTDTVGIRRKKREEQHLEHQGALRTLSRLQRASVALLVVDPFMEGITHQDQSLGQAITDSRVGAILVVTKNDLKAPATPERAIEKTMRAMFPHLSYAPIVFVSSTRRQGLNRLARLILEVYANFGRSFTKEELATALKGLILFPKQFRKKRPAAIELEQVHEAPPEFLIRRWKQQKTPIAIIDLIAKNLRSSLPLVGTPITVHVEKVRKMIPNRKRYPPTPS